MIPGDFFVIPYDDQKESVYLLWLHDPTDPNYIFVRNATPGGLFDTPSYTSKIANRILYLRYDKTNKPLQPSERKPVF